MKQNNEINVTTLEKKKDNKVTSRPRISKATALVLATNIVDGVGDLKFKDIPPRYKEAVREQLIALDAGHLANE